MIRLNGNLNARILELMREFKRVGFLEKHRDLKNIYRTNRQLILDHGYDRDTASTFGYKAVLNYLERNDPREFNKLFLPSSEFEMVIHTSPINPLL